MIGRVKEISRSRLFRNLVSLYAVQGTQYLIPLVTFPWLVRSLGLEGYGMINLAGAFGGYLQVACDYGFVLTATQVVANSKHDPAKLNRAISSIILAKLLIAILVGVISIGTVIALPTLRSHASILFLGSLGALASTFLPSWLFQGMEDMKALAASTIATRIFQMAAILYGVHRPQDLVVALWINILAGVANSVAAWIIAHKRFHLRIILVPFAEIRSALRDGLEVFLSQLGVLLFVNTNVMVLGSVASARDVGIYSVADRIIRLGIQAGGPLGTAIFPRAASLLRTAPREGYLFLRRVLGWGSLFFSLVTMGLIFLSPTIVRFVNGASSPEIVSLVRLLSPLPLTVFLDNLFGTQILLNLGYRRQFMFGPITTGLIAIGCQLLLVPLFHAQGAAWSLLISESWCLAYFWYLGHKASGFPTTLPKDS